MTPVGNVVTDDEDGTPKSQLAVNPPPASVSKTSMVTVDVDDPWPQKDGGNLADAPKA